MATAFLEVVKCVINKWTAFQIAIAHGMGGPFAKEKVEWLCSVLADFFQQNSDLHVDEVGEYLEEILNNEFDTLIEDGSLEDTCQRLTKYYKWYKSNEMDKIRNDIEILNAQVPTNLSYNSNGMDEGDECIHNAGRENSANYSNNGEMDVTNSSSDMVTQMQELNIQSDEADEWTVVTRSHRKGRPK